MEVNQVKRLAVFNRMNIITFVLHRESRNDNGKKKEAGKTKKRGGSYIQKQTKELRLLAR